MRPVLALLVLAACDEGSVRGPQGDDTALDDTAADTGPVDTGPADTDPPAPFNGCTAPDGPRAAGTWDDPVVLVAPFSDRADTTGISSTVDVYDCAPDKPESGGEIVYTVEVAAPGTLRAEVVEDDAVDVDLHLLRDGACLARANTTLAWPVEAGTYTLVVDTYGTTPHPGAYDLFVTAWPDGAWAEVALPFGTWRHLTQPGTSWDALFVAPSRVHPVLHDGCETVPSVLADRGAAAAINAGFFDACAPLDFVRADGVTLARITASFSTEQRVVGWDSAGPTTAWVARDADWTGRENAVGSWPSVVEGGVALLEPDRDSTFYDSRHPRTALGVSADGRLILFAADGRSDEADGLRMDELADAMVGLGAIDAVNLDGGGSTTFAIAGCGPGGVVNQPSDGSARPVSDGLYVDP